jgi:hypothetical protein
MAVVITPEQRRVCERFGVDPGPADPDLMVGIASVAVDPAMPINGLRHLLAASTTGWFIWGGEWSDADDFFRPSHAGHLEETLPIVLPYLAVPPSWRFLLAPAHEDVWYDDSLLDV